MRSIRVVAWSLAVMCCLALTSAACGSSGVTEASGHGDDDRANTTSVDPDDGADHVARPRPGEGSVDDWELFDAQVWQPPSDDIEVSPPELGSIVWTPDSYLAAGRGRVLRGREGHRNRQRRSGRHQLLADVRR